MKGTDRRRILRWAAPAAVLAAVAVAASGVLAADANPPLPPKTAAALLVDLQHPQLGGLSGTIVQKSDLGLPLPSTGGNVGGETLATLLTSSHTLRVWNSGTTKQRLALLDPLGESDAVRNGRDLWLWSSTTHTATHYLLPPDAATDTHPVPEPTGLTPQQAADAALRAIDPTTVVKTDGTGSVAGRAAYELVLSPRDTRSLIGQVRLAMDAETHLALRMQIYGQNSGAGPAFEVGFTRISYAQPGDEQFRFSAPPGATVTQGDLGELLGESRPGTGSKAGGQQPSGQQPSTAPARHPAGTEARTVGTGWTAVVVFPDVQLPTGGNVGRSSTAGQLDILLNGMQRVTGGWGSGRLLTSKLVSALLTDDGRLLVGAVTPDVLYAAAGHR